MPECRNPKREKVDTHETYKTEEREREKKMSSQFGKIIAKKHMVQQLIYIITPISPERKWWTNTFLLQIIPIEMSWWKGPTKERARTKYLPDRET